MFGNSDDMRQALVATVEIEMPSMLPAVLKRIEALLAGLGKTALQASIDAGLGPDFIRDLRRGKVRSPSLDSLTALAGALETTPEFLAFGAGAATANRKLPLMGESAAGVWIDTDGGEADELAPADIPVAADPRFPAEQQYALSIRGNSIDKVARPPGILICVNTKEGAIAPEHGDIVIVERRHSADGSIRIERTARRYIRDGDDIRLCFESTDPRWKEITLRPADEQDGDAATAIVAVVVQAIRPFRFAFE